ncbi:MAG: hypothetical protein J0M04_20785 [Verrucomicrobia bacterium]|nr:hypothetical protein [Verrucomicrobiota bacterium]
MTDSNTDKQAAVELLQLRADGYSLGRIFGKMRREHLLYLTVAIGASFLGFKHPDPLWLLIAGLFAGFLVRDCHWLRAGKSQWPFASRVTDWSKVERMAGVHHANAKEEANKS